MQKVAIVKENIPPFAMNPIAELLASTVRDFFRDPEHQSEFAQWKKERQAAEAAREGK